MISLLNFECGVTSTRRIEILNHLTELLVIEPVCPSTLLYRLDNRDMAPDTVKTIFPKNRNSPGVFLHQFSKRHFFANLL